MLIKGPYQGRVSISNEAYHFWISIISNGGGIGVGLVLVMGPHPVRVSVGNMAYQGRVSINGNSNVSVSNGVVSR